MAKKQSYLQLEFAALVDTYIALMYNNEEPNIVNCSVVLLDSTATDREAKNLLNRFRVLITRNYGADYWSHLGIVRPSVFYRKTEDTYTFFMTRGLRKTNSYD